MQLQGLYHVTNLFWVNLTLIVFGSGVFSLSFTCMSPLKGTAVEMKTWMTIMFPKEQLC